MSRRAAQLSLLDVAPKPVGPLPMSVQTGMNGDLVARVAPMYLTGSVLDCTYGRGGWWTRYTPAGLVSVDLHKPASVRADFRALPFPDGSFDAVCYDPPYVATHGNSGTIDFRDRFGLTDRHTTELGRLLAAGLGECARVSRRWVLAKCMDYTNGRKLILGHHSMMSDGLELGLQVWDDIVHHAGSGPCSQPIHEPVRCRRAHSFLVVFRKPRTKASPARDPRGRNPTRNYGREAQ